MYGQITHVTILEFQRRKEFLLVVTDSSYSDSSMTTEEKHVSVLLVDNLTFWVGAPCMLHAWDCGTAAFIYMHKRVAVVGGVNIRVLTRYVFFFRCFLKSTTARGTSK